MFERSISHDLMEWKNSSNRKPLVLRGARQVGKTTIIHHFSKSFEQYIYLNLERNEDKFVFTNKQSINEMVDAIFFLKNKSRQIQDTLIFIDEIQEVPEALAALRYFYEDYPQLYVIAAGSLLEMAFDNQISYPVGRLEYKVLHPFSFEEFLLASGETMALEQYNTIPIASFAHEKMLQLFHLYTLIGGMPEVIKQYIEHRDLNALKSVYESLLLSYIDDVEKYARNTTQTQIIRHAIRSCFSEAGSRIKFHGFGASSYASREMGEALRTLEKTKLIYLIYPTTQTALPYQPDIKKSPRLHLLDTGLVNYFAGVQKEVFSSHDLTDVYQGRISEHIVGQEILANNTNLLHTLLFWVRDKVDASAEVDYLYVKDGIAIPVEVKSGKVGKLKSLFQFMETSNVNIAIRLYAGKFQTDQLRTTSGKPFILLNLPYYLAGNLDKYIEKYKYSHIY
ncbi:MAG: AAA family ATPase [Paludibacter sp.]|nr:AAA family ATPase [Paludibacter sp.]